jgi:excisionase family DNA binding protein
MSCFVDWNCGLSAAAADDPRANLAARGCTPLSGDMRASGRACHWTSLFARITLSGGGISYHGWEVTFTTTSNGRAAGSLALTVHPEMNACNTSNELPDVLTVPEVAKVLRISRNRAYEAVRTGAIPSVRLGRRVLVLKSEVRALFGPDGAHEA